MHVIAAAVALKEAQTPAFKTYQEQIVKNAKALAQGLLEQASAWSRRHRQPLDVG